MSSMEKNDILTTSIIKGLGDKLYERRKIAALEVEKIVRDHITQNDHPNISALINTLINQFNRSTQSHSRNGGLIALAAVAIALGPLIHRHLRHIISPIIDSFSDHDSRVRYYACESAYNVAKVARSSILVWFNEIFDALTKLSVDGESSVKNGAELLDRLIKDIVSEKSTYSNILPTLDIVTTNSNILPTNSNILPTNSNILPTNSNIIPTNSNIIPTNSNIIPNSNTIPNSKEITNSADDNGTLITIDGARQEENDAHPLSPSSMPDIFLPVTNATNFQGNNESTAFNLPRFIPLLTERIHVTNASSRLFLVQWIFVLNSVPDLELLTFLPEFLNGLLVYLSDPNIDVRTATLNILGDFLKEISSTITIQNDLAILGTVNQMTYISGQGIELNFGKMTSTLAKFLSNSDQETQSTALRWINCFIGLARNLMLPFTPLLLSAILPTLSHPINTIKSLAIDANTNLFTLVLDWSMSSTPSSIMNCLVDLNSTDDPFDIVNTVVTLMQLCQDEHEDTRVGSLEWLLMLHKKYPKQVMNSDQTIFQGLLKTLSDYSEEVVRRDLQLLAQISHSSDDEYFTKFMLNLLNLFSIDRRLLETRGSLIIRQLCLSLNPERMYRAFGLILEQEEDLEFATTMVQTLNLILITAPELMDMRLRLKNVESKEGSALFCALYRSWCHNPIAVFSLCLLSQAYEHASNLMKSFGDLDINVQFLIQTDKLVQLIESPVFTFLRLQLLEPDRYPYLYKCLYGILMLLPQSSAFATLRNRLNSISSLAIMHTPTSAAPVIPTNSSRKPKNTLVEPGLVTFKWSEFQTLFKSVQNRHERARRNLIKPERELSIFKDDHSTRLRSGSLGSLPSTMTSIAVNGSYSRSQKFRSSTINSGQSSKELKSKR